MSLGVVLAMLAAGPSASAETAQQPSFPIVELRQYTLHEGKRDELIKLFEREFIESQEAVGMKVVGTFTDLDHPDRFVWVRGFSDMASRKAGLGAFYGGPVWQAHRDEANATMIDSDNVLLLEAPDAVAQFSLPASRPALGETAPAGLVVATIYYLTGTVVEAVPTFEKKVKPALEKAGIQPLAWFVSESAPNNFPRLPVREDGKVLVWFAAFAGAEHHTARRAAIDAAASALTPLFEREPETLRLKPTSRSLIRGAVAAGSEHDFDFLLGRWNVRHRLLKTRGRGSKDWLEFSGTADTRPLLGGLCNVEEHLITGRDSGVALRCYDRAAKRWAIYWVSDRDGRLELPVYGGFSGTEGLFYGDDIYRGRAIKVRFLWHRLQADHARWEQAFSFDGGSSWETNWVMEFERTS
jgi:hypothetical protein